MNDNKVIVELELDLSLIHRLYGLAIAWNTTVDEVVVNILNDYIKGDKNAR